MSVNSISNLGVFSALTITYTKGEVRTRNFVPTLREELLGEGDHGKVYVHAKNRNWVVKKSLGSLENEYQVGSRLDHPCFVKMHNLFVKKCKDREIHKLVMNRVDGITLAKAIESNLLSNKILIRVLKQLKEGCLHLYQRGVVWEDLGNFNNFMINEQGDITLIDFDWWRTEEDPTERAESLFIRAQELVSMLLENVKLLDHLPIYVKQSDPLQAMNSYQEQQKFLGDFFDRVIGAVSLYNHSLE